MQQYLQLLQAIKDNGTKKSPSRNGMPGSTSLFGYQFRHNLQDGFPLLTTKKIYWKGVIVELLWFLRGDTNIKYLIDNNVNIWNEDAYQYYLKRCKENEPNVIDRTLSFELFISYIKNSTNFKELEIDSYKNSYVDNSLIPHNYVLGDTGFQYGRVWRRWELSNEQPDYTIDQIEKVINSLKNNPESRRHIVTALDPANDENLALYWCHSMFQFNCRPLSHEERVKIYSSINDGESPLNYYQQDITEKQWMDEANIPKYYLDCQLYQRSADVFLGVPFNIASYSLLIHIISKITNMIPGDFVHTFGDVHIYDDHTDSVDEQLSRTPTKLPNLSISNRFDSLVDKYNEKSITFDELIYKLDITDFIINDYNPQTTIKGKLSTGLK